LYFSPVVHAGAAASGPAKAASAKAAHIISKSTF